MADGKFIAYFRVSTAKQGRSGLGLEGQRTAVMAYLNGGSWNLAAEFTEVESGKNNDRPELAKAMHMCRLTGATLVIAKLDRLSRNAAFLLNLRDSGIEFVAADMPAANRMTVGIMALVAEEEGRAISDRTKKALAASKKKLGGWRGGPVVDSTKGTQAAVEAADAFAAKVAPIIQDLKAQGLSLRGIAAELASKGILTARGGVWTATGVSNILARV